MLSSATITRLLEARLRFQCVFILVADLYSVLASIKWLCIAWISQASWAIRYMINTDLIIPLSQMVLAQPSFPSRVLTVSHDTALDSQSEAG